MLYSDDLPEAPGRKGRPLGFDRVQPLFARGGSPPDIRRQLLSALDRHLAGPALRDDFSVIVVTRTGPCASAALPNGV